MAVHGERGGMGPVTTHAALLGVYLLCCEPGSIVLVLKALWLSCGQLNTLIEISFWRS